MPFLSKSGLTLCAMALACLLCMGCGGCGGTAEPTPVPLAKTYNDMKTLGVAYWQYNQKNKRPPQKLDDLKPFVDASINLEEMAKSSDRLDFVIVWGVDPQKYLNTPGGMPIIIYEAKSHDGLRFVCKFNDVEPLSEEDFKKSKFPEGHTPAT